MKTKIKKTLRYLFMEFLKALFFLFCTFVSGFVYFVIIKNNLDKFDTQTSSGLSTFIFGLGVCMSLIHISYECLGPRIFGGKKISVAQAFGGAFFLLAIFTICSLLSPKVSSLINSIY